jgi:hypothetical protein
MQQKENKLILWTIIVVLAVINIAANLLDRRRSTI